MKRFALTSLALLALAACSDSTTAPKAASAWNQRATPSISIAPYTLRSNVVAAAKEAGKPLTTLVFDELPFQPVNGVSIAGVTFGFTLNGHPFNDANYNSFGPDPGPFVQCPCLEGNTRGTLTITFDKPTTIVEFGVGLSTTVPLATGFTVDVIGPSGKSRGVFPVATSPAPTFTGAEFSYNGAAVSEVVVTFDSVDAARFVIDNLTYHTAPK
jgi:hypothetical protein